MINSLVLTIIMIITMIIMDNSSNNDTNFSLQHALAQAPGLVAVAQLEGLSTI